MTFLQLGSTVPDSDLLATGATPIKFSNYRGRYVLLYFYPKDNTPACTAEACAFRDKFEQFTALNTVIFGVSRDSVRIHESFKTKHTLPFELLSDTEERLCQLFGVIALKNLYGKQVRGIERSTFLIDPNGVVVREWRKVKVKQHCDEVLIALQALGA